MGTNDFESSNSDSVNGQPSEQDFTAVEQAFAPEFIELLGDPPVIDGEDPEEFQNLLARTVVELKPNGLIEIFWTHRFACLIWEVRRLQRFKTDILTIGRVSALGDLLNLICEDGIPIALVNDADAKAYVRGDKNTVKRIDGQLAASGYGTRSIMTQAHLNNAEIYEKLERLIADAERRLERALKEFEARRERLASQVRAFAKREVRDLEIEPGSDTDSQDCAA